MPATKVLRIATLGPGVLVRVAWKTGMNGRCRVARHLELNESLVRFDGFVSGG